MDPYEMEPEIRRRSGIILLGAVVVLAAVLLVLSLTGRLSL
jgi:cell division protein ZapA (FtsZ GTPase activity inhibitor)